MSFFANVFGRRRPAADALAHLNLGLELLGQGQVKSAQQSLARALALLESLLAREPEHAGAWLERGQVMLAMGRPAEALEDFQKVLALRGPSADVLSSCASALMQQGLDDDALVQLDEALRLEPGHRNALLNRCRALVNLLYLEAAEKATRAALAAHPHDADLHWMLAMVLLLSGRFDEGWREHEWRWKSAPRRAHPLHDDRRRWTGQEDLRGRTIILFGDSERGDSLQMLRYVPWVVGRAARVLLQLAADFHSLKLMRDFGPSVTLLQPGEALPDFDFHCALTSLPLLFATAGQSSIAPQVPYLRADAADVARWRERLAPARGRPTVGLVWSASAAHDNDHGPSIALAALQEHLPGGIFFVSLQKQLRASDRAALDSLPELHDWGGDLRNFDDTAALIEALDLVVSVDTSVAHLAGALGKPVWVLLPFCPGWQWMTGRSDSPWYPTATLLRQVSPGDWAGVLRELHSRLAAFPSVPACPSLQDQAAQRLKQGNDALAAGVLGNAQEHYRAASALAPRDPSGFVNLGYALLEQGKAAAAEASLDQAVLLGGGPDAQYLLGQAHAARGRWSDARECYRAAIVARPDFGFAWRELAVASEHLGEPASALDAYQRAASCAPELVDAVSACARLHFELGQHEEALAAALRWAAVAPNEPAAAFLEGQVLHVLQRHAQALAALDRCAALAPDNAAVQHTRANILFALGRWEEADCSYAQALLAMPQLLEARVNRGVVLDRLGRHTQALDHFHQVLEQQPDHRLALYYLPMLLVSLGRVPEALNAVTKARASQPDDPDVEWHYAFTHLLAGRMREGWPAYEARWRTVAATGAALARHPFRQPLWTGQSLEGKLLLVYPEQGLGDILQVIRFVPVLEARGARVLVWAPRSLAELASTVSPHVVVAARLEDFPPFDYQCPLMSVPGVLSTTLQTLPARVPYLRADAQRRGRWAQRLGEAKGLRVGVVWSGNAAQRNDANRSIPLATFAQLDVPGCEFVALQNLVRDEDRPAMQAWPQLRFFGDELETFADTAALASEMDLVVSVCTSGAHLAGALGLPMWVLLSYRADWRWLLDREDSPWYPTARLFRQDASRQWAVVIERARQALIERRDAALRSRASA